MWHSYAIIRDIPSQDNEGKRELTSKCEPEKRAYVEGPDSHAHWHSESESDPEPSELELEKSQASIHFIMPNDRTIN